MNFFNRVIGLAALVAAVGGPFGVSAASLNKEGEWSTTVKVTRGQEHTFWVTGLTADSAVFGLDIAGSYTYKEDGETYEDEVWPFESCEVENASGGWDKYVLLTAEDWEWVPSTVKSVTFKVYVSGFYDEEVKANNNFTFGHAAGRDSYPGEIEPPVPPTPVGEADNPLTFSLKTLTASDPNPGKLDVSAADEFEGLVYYIKTASLVAGQKYRFGYSGSMVSNFTMSASLTGTDNLFTTEGIGKPYPDWEACDRAYEVIPKDGGVYYIRLDGVVAGDAFALYHASLPKLTPTKHLPTSEFDLAVGAESAKFSPGYMNDPASYAYDEVIDQQLFRITGYDKGENLVFRTEGADSDLIMRLYDSKGTVLAENFTVGGGLKDCQIAWTTTAKYVKTSETTILYLGVCQKLAEGEEPTAGPVTLNVERVDLVDEPTAVTAVPDKADGDPRNAAGVIPSDARSLGQTAWANTFTLAARGGVTYKLKARLTETGLDNDNDLTICATAYTLSGKTRTILKDAANQKIEKSDLIDPKANGFLTITPTAHGTVYVEVSVADGEYGAGKGLDYGSYEICATAAGDYGILQVPMAGAPQELMGWKILSGPGITASKEPYYPAGAGAIVPAGKYTVAAQLVKDYEKVDAKGFAEVDVKAGVEPSKPALYKYRDTFDLATPNDDAWDKKPTELKPTSTKPVEAIRSLWKDDGKGGSDPADWYFVKPAGDGAYYRFDLKANAGSPRIDVFGPDSTNAVCKGVPTEAFDNVYLLKQISTEKNAKYYVRVTREPDTDDNSYVLTASTATPGQIKLTKTEYSVKDGTAYVDVGVSRTGKDGTVMLMYRTTNDTAVAGKEYYPTNGVLTWLNGDQKEQKIRVNLIPDLVSKWFADKSFKMVFETFTDDGKHAFANDEYIPMFQVTSKSTGSGANKVTTVTTNDTVTIKITPAGKKTPGTIQLADCENPKKPVIAVVAGETAEIALERAIGTNGLVGVSVVSAKGTANKNGEGIDYETINIPELTWADGASGKSETIRIVTKKTPGDFTGTKTFTLKLTALKTNTKVDPRVFDNPTIASQTITVNIVNDKYEQNVTDFAKTFPKGSAVQMKEGKKDSWFYETDGGVTDYYSVVSRKFTGPSRVLYDSNPPYGSFNWAHVAYVPAAGATLTMPTDCDYEQQMLPAAVTAENGAFVVAGEKTLVFDREVISAPGSCCGLGSSEAVHYRVYVMNATESGKSAATGKKMVLGDPETEVLPDAEGNYKTNLVASVPKYNWRVDACFTNGEGQVLLENVAKTAWTLNVIKPESALEPLAVEGIDDGKAKKLYVGKTEVFAISSSGDTTAKIASVGNLPTGFKLLQSADKKSWSLEAKPTKAGDYQFMIQETIGTGTTAKKSPTFTLKFSVTGLSAATPVAPTVDKAVLTPGKHRLFYELDAVGMKDRLFFAEKASDLGKPDTEIDPYGEVTIEAGKKYAWQVYTYFEGAVGAMNTATNKSAQFTLTGASAGDEKFGGQTYETRIVGEDAYENAFSNDEADWPQEMTLRQRLAAAFLVTNYLDNADITISDVKVIGGKLPDGMKPEKNTRNDRTNPTGDDQWYIRGTPTKAGTFQAVVQATFEEVVERDSKTDKVKKSVKVPAATVVMDFEVEEVTAPADLSFTLAGPGRFVYTATDARIPANLDRTAKTETKTNFISKTSETLKLSDIERLHSYEYVRLDAVTPMAPTVDKAVVEAGDVDLSFYRLADDEANGIGYRVYLRNTADSRIKLGDAVTEVKPVSLEEDDFASARTNLAADVSKWEWRVDSFFRGGPVTNTVKTAWKLSTAKDGAPSTHISGRDAWGYQVDNKIYDQVQVINLYQGVKAEFSVDVDPAITNKTSCLASVKLVSGKLPDGVKVATAKPKPGEAKWAFLSGTPTKAGDFEALLQLSYTDADKTTATTALMRFHVRAAGSSIGTFNGLATAYDSTNLVHRLAQVQFTSAAGKLSSKVTIAGKSYTFADTGFVRITGGDPDDETVPATLQAELTQIQKVKEYDQEKKKDVDVSYTNVLSFAVTDAPLTNATVWATNSTAELTVQMEALPDIKGNRGQYGIWYEGKAYRDNSAVKEWAAAAAKFAGYYTVALVPMDAMDGQPLGNGYMTMTLDAKGGAKMAGALADGTAYSASTKAAFDLVGDEIAVRVPLYAYKSATAGGNLFGGWFTIRYPKGCVPTTNLAETPLDAVPVAVCEFGDTTMAWLNEDPNSTYYGPGSAYDGFSEGFDLTLCPVGGWYDTVVNLQRYYRSADFSYNEFSVDTAAGNDLWLLQELLTENSKSQYDDDPDYKFVAEASANGQAVDVVGNDISVVKQTLVKKIDSETGRAGKYNDWSNSVNAANVKLTFKRATGIMTGTCDLWYAGNKVINAAGDTTYEEKTFANCKHAGVLLLSRDPAQNWLGDTDEACTWTAGSVVIPQSIPLGNNKTRKWNASFRFNIKATKVNRSWGEQPPYSGTDD